MDAQKRKDALRRYLVFRVKVIEFFDIAAVRLALTSQKIEVPNPVLRKPTDFSDSLRTPQLSWLALLVDKNKDGLNAIKLWCELFPNHRDEIDRVWKSIEPTWEIIRVFRNKAGFHADMPLPFFKARHEVFLNQQEVTRVVEEFAGLLAVILHAEEQELPDFSYAIDDFLNELERDLGARFNRVEFRRHLMLPKG